MKINATQNVCIAWKFLAMKITLVIMSQKFCIMKFPNFTVNITLEIFLPEPAADDCSKIDETLKESRVDASQDQDEESKGEEFKVEQEVAMEIDKGKDTERAEETEESVEEPPEKTVDEPMEVEETKIKLPIAPDGRSFYTNTIIK